jgi:hypothetical protein
MTGQWQAKTEVKRRAPRAPDRRNGCDPEGNLIKKMR